MRTPRVLVIVSIACSVSVVCIALSGCVNPLGPGRGKPKRPVTEGVERGVEEAELESLKKRGGGGPGLGSSFVHANPESMDFGEVSVGSERTQLVALANPAGFTVTVVNITVEGRVFLTPNPPVPFDIPAHGQTEVTVTFRPLRRGQQSGYIRAEIESAGARVTQVRLKGRGVG